MSEEKTYSAKQVATRIGTDAKTLRKFFRSSASPFEAVGQGGRYEFPAKELPEIKKLFDRWNKAKNDISGKGPKVFKPEPNGKVNLSVTPTLDRISKRVKARQDEANEELLELEQEPTDDELDDLEFDDDIELDDE